MVTVVQASLPRVGVVGEHKSGGVVVFGGVCLGCGKRSDKGERGVGSGW